MRKMKDWLQDSSTVVKVVMVLTVLALIVLLIPRGKYPPVDAERLARDPSLGPLDAPITIIEYGDFACESCMAWHEARVLDIILEKYPQQVRFIWRDNARISTASLQAAAAAQCAFDQGKFWPYHDLLFENPLGFSSAGLKSYAGELGLDQAQFDSCLDNHMYINKVKHSMKLAGEHGFSFTPAFLVNDEIIIGPPSADYLSGLIEELLNSIKL